MSVVNGNIGTQLWEAGELAVIVAGNRAVHIAETLPIGDTQRLKALFHGLRAPTLREICTIIVAQGGTDMDTDMTFRMDSDVKAEMAAICAKLGMTTSTAFNVFANAFVRAKGMPFAVTIQEPDTFMSKEAMLADTDQLLAYFASDYKRMAE